MRLWVPVLLVDLGVGAGCRIQEVVVAVSVHLVRTALGHGIHYSTSSLTKLGFEARTGDLKLTNHVFAELVGDAGAPDLLSKESVIVVSTIDGVVIKVAGDAVETNHSEVAIGGRAWGQQSKVSEVPSVERQRLDATLVHDGAKRGLGRIDQGSFSDYGNRGVDLPDSKLRMDDCPRPYRNRDVFQDQFAEPGFPD